MLMVMKTVGCIYFQKGYGMKKMIFIMAVMVLCLGGCFSHEYRVWGYDEWRYARVIPGSGKVVEEVREVGRFTGLKVSCEIDVEVRYGDAYSVTLIGDENILALIKTKVRGDDLKILDRRAFVSEGGIKAVITVVDLKEVRVSEKGFVAVSGIDQEGFGAIVWDDGRAVLSGKADGLYVKILENGCVDATGLKAGDVEVYASGRSCADVVAEKSLIARASDRGSVVYRGGVKEVGGRVSGLGKVLRGE